MKGTFNAYVLWPFGKNFIFEFLTCVRTHDYTVALNNKWKMGHFLWSSNNIWSLSFMIWTWKKAFIQIGKKSYNFIRQEEMSVAVLASILQQGVC